MINILKFKMHEDHAHAWLEVDATLAESTIGTNVTSFSYISDDSKTLYLEEDCDATAFLDALEQQKLAFEIETIMYEKDCFIRDLSSVAILDT